jgi:diguanylate cyclase (GGDEF)-like protein
MDALNRWAPAFELPTPPDPDLTRLWNAARAATSAHALTPADLPAALSALEALRMLADRASRGGLADTRTFEGEIRCEIGGRLATLQRPQDARVELEIALELLPAGEPSESACNAYATLSAVCEAAGDHRAALDALRHFVTLRAAVQEAEVQQRISELEARLAAERQTLLRHDPLTGLYNRRHVGELVAREISRAKRLWRPMTFALLRVDPPQAGPSLAAQDDLLRGVSLRLPTGLRDHDIAARWDADVFCFVLPDTDVAAAEVPLQRLVGRVRAEPIATPAGPVPATASVGVTQLEPGDATLDELVLRAERALDRARAEGGDRHVHWPFPMA